MNSTTCARVLLINLLFFLVPGPAHANIVYAINRTVGSNDISGYIETDGTLGSIGQTAVVAWSLDVFGFFGATTESMTSSDSSLVFFGSGFLATATELVFDFNQLDSIGFVGKSGAKWCLGGTDANCSYPSAEVLQTSLATETASRSGQTVIGVASVPVPAAVWLFGSGLLSLLGISRHAQTV